MIVTKYKDTKYLYNRAKQNTKYGFYDLFS